MKAHHLVLALLLAALPALLGSSAIGEEERRGPVNGGPAKVGVFPLAEIRPGLKGYGLTVKAGTKIERFEIEVIDVIRNYLVKQDVILVRCLGEAFADHQVAQGMSGSPVYFDGRIAGALAYTWAWAKHPLAGITPIEAMLVEGKRKLEGRPTGMEPPTRLRRAASGSGTRAGRRLVPIGTPFAVSGFSEAAQQELQQELGPMGFHVCGGGSAAGAPGNAARWVDRKAELKPGSALVVDILRGDYNASALGTCTHIEGDTVYGFGHTFNGLGETVMPMSIGYVYTMVASREIAFKIGGSIRQVGAILQDRPSGVVGKLGHEARMVPVSATFTNAVTKRKETFRFEVTPNRLFFTRMTILALRESFARAETTLGRNTKRYRMTVKIKGLDEWSYEDVIAGFDGGFQRVLIGLLDRPLNHNTQRPQFESFHIDIEVEHRDRRAYLRSATASADEVRPGESVTLTVGLETKDGGEAVERRMKVRVPHDAPAGNYVVTVTGGDYVPGDVAAAVDIADLPKLYASYYKSTELVAVLPTGRVHLDLDGRLVRDVPLSSLPRLVRSPGGLEGKLRPVTEKVRVAVPYVVSGSKKVVLRVVR